MYYLCICSLFPLCNLELNSHLEELTMSRLVIQFKDIFIECTVEIFERSYISMGMFCIGSLGMFLWTESHLNVQLRTLISMVHLIAHYIGALTVIILMEMIIEAAVENELIGIKNPFETFRSHFPGTHQVIEHLDGHYTFGVITKFLKMLFTVVDVTGFHVSLRKTICTAKAQRMQLLMQHFGGVTSGVTAGMEVMDTLIAGDLKYSFYNLVPSRFTRVLYHITAFWFYFIFAAPLVSFIVGIYLFLSAKYFGKFNEAFSSLRLQTYKNFVRFHLKRDGSLHCFVIGVDNVPRRWRQDPKWDGRGQLMSIPKEEVDDGKDGSICHRISSSGFSTPTKRKHENKKSRTAAEEAILNARDMRYLGPSYTWNYPSRWIAYDSKGKTNMCSKEEYRRVKIIDQFVLR